MNNNKKATSIDVAFFIVTVISTKKTKLFYLT